MQFLNVRGCQIAFAASEDLDADKTPLLFVHGAGGSSHVWRNQIQAPLSETLRVAVDLPGHARSQGQGAGHIESYRDFILDFVQAAGWERLILAGHSMGGAVIQAFALAHPHLLECVVLVGTGARLRVAPEVFSAVSRGEDFTEAAYAPGTDPELIQEAEKEFSLTDPEVRYSDFLACDRFDVMDRVDQIAVPALVVCGREDRLTPVKYSRYLADRLPRSWLEIIPSAGHMVMWEQPGAFNEALASFLRQ
jgi:pimeloyl-ACP methyl ester carboxylesterase